MHVGALEPAKQALLRWLFGKQHAELHRAVALRHLDIELLLHALHVVVVAGPELQLGHGADAIVGSGLHIEIAHRALDDDGAPAAGGLLLHRLADLVAAPQGGAGHQAGGEPDKDGLAK